MRKFVNRFEAIWREILKFFTDNALTLEKCRKICYNTDVKMRESRFSDAKRTILRRIKMKQSTLKAITVSAVIFLALLTVALVINVVKLTTANRKKAQLAETKAKIEREITNADGQIDYFGSDEYVSRYAREYLNMKDKDEEVITGK